MERPASAQSSTFPALWQGQNISGEADILIFFCTVKDWQIYPDIATSITVRLCKTVNVPETPCGKL